MNISRLCWQVFGPGGPFTKKHLGPLTRAQAVELNREIKSRFPEGSGNCRVELEDAIWAVLQFPSLAPQRRRSGSKGIKTIRRPVGGFTRLCCDARVNWRRGW
jgi:hypothetical protein